MQKFKVIVDVLKGIISILLLFGAALVLWEVAYTIHEWRIKIDHLTTEAIPAKDAILHTVTSGGTSVDTILNNTKDTSSLIHNKLNQDFFDELTKYTRSQGSAALGAANNSRRITASVESLINGPITDSAKEVRNKVHDIDSAAINKLILDLLASGNMQLNNNGAAFTQVLNSSTKFIDSGTSFLTATQPEVVALLASLSKAIDSITVITSDPDLLLAIKNTNQILANVAVITDATGTILKKYAYPQQQHGFKRVLGVVQYGLRLVSGAGNLLVVIDKL